MLKMYKHSFFMRFFTVALIMTAATACAGSGPMMDEQTVSSYHDALERLPGDASAIEDGVANFQQTYGDLTRDNLAERVAELYAEDLYFNDTVHIIRDRETLVDYMARTGQNLDQNRVSVHKVIRDGADVYVRWEMTFVTRAVGKKIESHSIGMTHLRFNAEGRIILHQDFWDSGSALYAHLPVVGFFVRRAQGAMQ